MYYSDDIVSEVRSRADIVDIVGQYVALKKSGSAYKGLCPFHGEKTPSFSVNPRLQIFHCFGCGKGGDSIRFIMEYENLTFPEALRKLAEHVGVKLPEQKMDAMQAKNHDIKVRLLEINKAAAIFYCNLLRSPKGKLGLNYLKGRALSDDTLRSWGLGYAGQGKDTLYTYLRDKGYNDEILRESGLFTYTERGVYDKFFNRVIFPIMDSNNRVIGFGGRVMGQGEPKYLNSPETRLYEKSRQLYGLCYARRTREKAFILCEGYMDVIALHQAGFTQAVASLGTALTEEQCTLMKRFVNAVILTYDSDNAGIRAARRARGLLKAADLDARVIDLKPWKDPDEFIRNEGHDAFEKRLETARNAFLWECDMVKAEFDLNDPADRTRYTDRLAEMLLEFREPIEQDNYIRAVAREHMLPYEDLKARTAHFDRQKKEKESPLKGRVYLQSDFKDRERDQKKKRAANDPLLKSEIQLVTWLSEKQELIPAVRELISPEDLDDPVLQKVLSQVFEKTPVNAILDSFRDDDAVYRRVVTLFNGDLLPEEADEYSLKRGLEDVIRNIRMNRLDQEIESTLDAVRLQALFDMKTELQNLKL